ncbi:mitochondrial ribosomal protein S29 [Rhynchophorus ferrugineus]|uniref:Small ribosomal subunit protein mS29 n=1 Tax=Rhynchophorus ferrugineus TaxID=354439 RepID=A0A834M581_RHYFE|nr:hypothetical protein GWI33_014678 [Rhynchophorus ferrugineus]
MLKSTVDLLTRTSNFKKISCKRLSTVAQLKSNEKLDGFRTVQEDPLKHNSEHLAQFYTLSTSEKNCLFQHGGLPKSFEIQTKTFNETSFMIREPAIEIINYLKAIDYSKPPVKFVLFGKKGTGKTLSLAHILHYAVRDNFLIVHVPWVGNWMRRPKEFSNSDIKEGFVDINIDAAAWLLHFKVQNAVLLQKPEMRLLEAVQWNSRESTAKDVPLVDLIDHGINRIKFASRCVNILAEQVKGLSKIGVCKTLVAVDGFNAFFYPNIKVYTDKKEKVTPGKVTVTEGFLNLTKFDWHNSAIVVTVDELVIAQEDQISHYPRYLLGKTGFEHLDPFVPVHVTNYTKKELISTLDYYRERRWITSYPGQDDELYSLSAGNPYNLMKLCNGL